MATLGLIGLGNLGLEFGKRAVLASKRVVAYDKVGLLSLEGAGRAASIADVVGEASTVVSIVPDDAAASAVTEELLVAAAGRGEAARPLLHVSSSTISPAASEALAARHAAAGVGYVAAPIFARPENMRAGQASFAVAGGSAELRDRARAAAPGAATDGRAGARGRLADRIHARAPPRRFADALDCAAPRERCFDYGDAAPAANVAKLCGNFLIASSILALSEALALAEARGEPPARRARRRAEEGGGRAMAPERARERERERLRFGPLSFRPRAPPGLDREAVLGMLTATIFDCAIYKGYGGRVAARDHAAGGFALHHGLKDVSLVAQAAADAAVPMDLGDLLVRSFTNAANDASLADLDWSALGLHVSKNAGVDVDAPPK